MNLKHLECFVALTNTMNFSQAADFMYISQPAFSRYIASLESELDVPLFERDKRTVTLTAAGKAFLPYAMKMLVACDMGVHTAKRAKDGWVSSITLGFLHDARNETFPGFAAQFGERHPDVVLRLQEYPYFELHAALRAKEVDAILGSSELRYDPEEFGVLPFERHSYCAVLNRRHPLAGRESIHPQEIIHERFVILMHHLVLSVSANQITNICSQYGVTPNIISRSKVLPSVLFKVACNMGISILTETSVQFAPPEVVFVPLEQMKDYVQCLIWSREREKELGLFLEEFRTYYGL